MIRFS